METTLINARGLLCLDEANNLWTLFSLLKAIVTNAVIERCILYTTASVQQFVIKLLCILTTNNVELSDEAVAHRVLKLDMGNPRSEQVAYRSDAAIEREWREGNFRAVCWLDLVCRLSAVMRLISAARRNGQDDPTAKFRMSGFWSFVTAVAGQDGPETADRMARAMTSIHDELRNRLLPRWGDRVALGIEPQEIENWLRGVKRENSLANPTLDRARRVMSLVYKHGQRYGLIPRNQESNPLLFVRCKTQTDYQAVILTPEQAFAVLLQLSEPERTLSLLAASTGLRISECLGLQWQDVSFEESLIRVRRTWIWSKVWLPKSRASQAPVPMHPLLATVVEKWMHETPYAEPSHWVFPSFKLKGRQPRVANMLVSDYLRPAAVKAGVIAADWNGWFGFHNFRHSLASPLVRSKTDPKTVQALLRHSDVKTTPQLYSHGVSEDRCWLRGLLSKQSWAAEPTKAD